MATTLAPVDSREVVRCDHCLLVQFRTVNNNCRRCHSSLDEEPEPEPVVMSPPVMMPMPGIGRGHLNLATSIRSLRLRSGLSQRQLAGRMSVPRTYVSKIENEKATPTLSSLERLARALEVTVPELLSGGEKNRQDEISELVKDQFIAEILPFVSQLNGMQMSSILTQVRDLTMRPQKDRVGRKMWGQPPPGKRPAVASHTNFIRATSQLNAGTIHWSRLFCGDRWCFATESEIDRLTSIQHAAGRI